MLVLSYWLLLAVITYTYCFRLFMLVIYFIITIFFASAFMSEQPLVFNRAARIEARLFKGHTMSSF